MKDYFYAFSMCQSMFCSIPFPCHVWEERVRNKMLLFLPVVGLEIGACWALIGWLCRLLGFPALVSGLFLAIAPFLLTGFLHLDGFMDVTDAIGSCRDLEKRRAILKDSHVGSFAVIGMVLLSLSQFALAVSAAEADLRMLILLPGISRCCSGFAVDYLPSMSTSQFAGRQIRKSHLVLFCAWILGLLTLGFLICGRYGFAGLGCILAQVLTIRKGYRSLQGMNGDISGCAIVIGELAGLLIMAIL